MNLRHLAEFLRGGCLPENFLSEINSEVDNYRSGFTKKGSSLPIYVTEDNLHFVLGRNEVKRLCDMYLRGILDEWDIQYICNAIELASSFSLEDEGIKDVIFQLADPESNYPLSAATVRRLCNSL
jgi:hypothetical protein